MDFLYTPSESLNVFKSIENYTWNFFAFSETHLEYSDWRKIHPLKCYVEKGQMSHQIFHQIQSVADHSKMVKTKS